MSTVRNMTSSKGNKIANQFEITLGGTSFNDKDGKLLKVKSGTMFQSYDSNIAYRDYEGRIYLDSYYWDYSTTTGKYRNLFLGFDKRETEKRIASGEIVLVDMN